MALHAHEIEVTDQNAAEVGTKRTKDTNSPISISNSELLTARHTAAILGVTRQTVKNYIYKGRLKTYKTPGGQHRIHREDIMDLKPLNGRPSREELLENRNALYQGFIHTLRALTGALDTRDGITAGHSRRVANYVASLAEIMGIPKEERETIKLAALLHDVGKVFISEQILSKPGKLTDRERYFVRQHPELGEIAINGVGFLEETKRLIRHHHERFDGKGYPDGLSGEEIPPGARLISIAEAFDCMTSECIFQNKRTHEEAIKEIESQAWAQFDPEIVRIFSKNVAAKMRGDVIDQSE